MIAMQYEITLPADYDMGIIRARVATRGAGTDATAGLALKAYCIRERRVNGSPVNQYAPFYLWSHAAGMNAFLLGPGFATLCRDFGRPAVRHWTGLAFERGPAWGASIRSASRSTVAVPPHIPVEQAAARAREDVRSAAGTSDVHSAALAVDPRSWELVRFTLGADLAGSPSDTSYEVLHTSAPELQELPTG